jgi:hypothetical protein
MIEYLTTKDNNSDFNLFLKRLRETGCSYEVVVEDGKITKLYVRVPDDGNWKRVKFGRIIGSKMVSYIQTVYLPRLVDGNFIYDYNEKNKRPE